MADLTAINYARPKMMVPDGRGVPLKDGVIVTSLATNDTLNWFIPKGFLLTDLSLHLPAAIDSGVASVFTMGYLKRFAADTLTAGPGYFKPSANTLLRSSAVGVIQFGFAPIKFEVDVILQLVLTTGGTLAGGGTAVAWLSAIGSMQGVEGSSLTGLGAAQ